VGLVVGLLQLVLLVFVLFLLARLVLDWVQYFARDWRPTGFALVVAEIVYSVTDPPLRLLRRVIPPLTIGSVRLDLAFMILMLGCWFLLSLLPLRA
jgi:YggT family protein